MNPGMNDMEETTKNKNPEDAYKEYDNFAFHPYNVMLILILSGITALFLALSAAFVYTRMQNELPPVKLPVIFLFNSFILLASSAAMVWAKRAYRKDDIRKYQRALTAAIVLSIIFLAAQFVGWRQLFSQEIFFNSDNAASYLYVISGLHFAHVIAGLPFLCLFLLQARKSTREPVRALVYFSDPEKRLKLRLLTIYWHFLDALWIYLVIFLWINYLLR